MKRNNLELVCLCSFLEPKSTRAFVLLFLVSVAFLAACQPAGRVLETAAEVRSLSPEDALRGHPVKLRGVVTYYRAPLNTLIVQDATAAVLVDTSKLRVQVNSRQAVEV